MSIFSPILVFLLALTLALIVIRVGTMALMLTGLSREAARFQSHSAFTGVGFTTDESESIMGHPVRRHLTMALMMLGNIGIATVIATLTAALISQTTADEWVMSIVLLALGIGLLVVLAKSRWVERQLNRPIAFALSKFTHLDVRDYVSLLNLSSGFAVYEILVDADDWVANKSLIELGLAREGILVLGIQRQNKNYIGAPSGNSRIRSGDNLVIYGSLEHVRELDTRPAGEEGDNAHAKATEEYDSYLTEVQDDDMVVSGGAVVEKDALDA